MRHLTTEQLPSIEWWQLLRSAPVRRFVATIAYGIHCHPMDAAIAGLLEALAPPAFVEDARDRYWRHWDVRAVAAQTGRDVEDLVWQQRALALADQADDLGVDVEILVCLKTDADPPGIEKPTTNRQSGRRRKSKPLAGTAAIMRLYAREPWRRWYR